MTIWETLGIKPTTDVRLIKKAYAEQSKKCHPETDPEGFQLLYDAYHKALENARKSDNREMGIYVYSIDSASVIINESANQDISRLKTHAENKTNARTENESNDSKSSDEIFQEINKINIHENNDQKLGEHYQEQQEETLFDDIFDVLESEKSQYYRTTAMKGFIDLLSNPDKRYNWEEWKKYFESKAFLNTQYDKRFIKYLVDYLKEQQFISVHRLPKYLFIELCTVYGILTNDEIYKEDDVKPLIDILEQNHMGSDYIRLMSQEWRIQERRYAFHIYRSILREFDEGISKQTIDRWIQVLEDATYRFSRNVAYQAVKRSTLVFILLSIFLESQEQISKELYYALYKLFKAQKIKNGGDGLERMLSALEDKGSPQLLQFIKEESIKREDILIEYNKGPARNKSLYRNMKRKYSSKYLCPAILCVFWGMRIIVYVLLSTLDISFTLTVACIIFLSILVNSIFPIFKNDCFHLLKDFIYKNPQYTMEDLEDEFQTAEDFGKRVWVGDHFTFFINHFRLPSVVENDKIIWMYYQSVSKYNRNKGYIWVYSSHNKMIIPIKYKYAMALLQSYSMKYPHIVLGYSKELEEMFHNDIQKFMNLRFYN